MVYGDVAELKAMQNFDYKEKLPVGM